MGGLRRFDSIGAKWDATGFDHKSSLNNIITSPKMINLCGVVRKLFNDRHQCPRYVRSHNCTLRRPERSVRASYWLILLVRKVNRVNLRNSHQVSQNCGNSQDV